jgi:hypothetical protein
VILRPKSPNYICRFWGSNWETWATGFEDKLGETVATGFEVKPDKIVTTGFEAEPKKTILVILMSNHWQNIPVVLRSNYWQTVDPSFDAQLRNLRSSSPCARCRPHTMSTDLLIVWSPSTRPVRPFLILYTRSSTPTMILVTTLHAAPVTCTPRDKQTRFSTRTKIKVKQTEMS